MNISIFGLGYVGAVSAGCLADDGHHIIGVDPNRTKVDLINRGISPIIEDKLGSIIATAVRDGRLRATSSVTDAIENSDISLVCVGTPSQSNGSLDLTHVRSVCEEIGCAIALKSAFHVVAVRSTMLPGSMKDVVIPTLQNCSGKQAGRDFGICSNPEFLREGTAVHDYYQPPKTVIGEVDSRSGDVLASLYEKIDAPLIRVDVATAEMIKYTDNVWHALKVGFANEIGNVCKSLDLDGQQVMELFTRDRKLNLSSNYLQPGFAFGGSCLPKDVRALSYKAKILDIDTPILNSILPSNMLQIQRGVKMISQSGKRRIGILGFSFKAGTDDLRESPLVDVIEILIGKGFELKIFDRNVSLESIIGSNRNYILDHIPHISRLMVEDAEKILAHSEIIVIGNRTPEFRDIVSRTRPGQIVIDLVGIGFGRSEPGRYEGICW